MKRFGLFLALAIVATLPTQAYYHFLHYLPQGNAPEKFDLTALPNKTVTFFVSEAGPTLYSQNDTFNSVISQIRQATQVWNGVSTSDIRVAFGGLEKGTTPQNQPGGDVVFEDLPPGLYGYGGPTSTTSPVTNANGTFLPIARTVVHLNRNVTLAPGPSYAESFFLTAVHEMGHALGLQHTFTSAAMSTATTRATSLSKPIDVDDVAGLSVLYPTAAFASLGSISGKIAAGGQGIHMASVVAIRSGGSAISAMTNPDGTYRIDGVPPGTYTVYVHSLPPDADIRGPWDASGKIVAGSPTVNTLFYPGTTDILQAGNVVVKANAVTTGINIAVSSRPYVPLYDVSIYAFLNQTSAVKPAVVDLHSTGTTVVASGAGLGANGQAPGLNVIVMGGAMHVNSNGVRPYVSGGYTYVALDLGLSIGATPGPQHVLFNTPDYLYVLPSGMMLVQSAPPTIASVSPNADGSVTVTGSNWASDSLIYFDGLPSTIRKIDPVAGIATVIPPMGASGQVSTLVVYNSDGQNSQFLQANSPLTYQYRGNASPQVTAISPASLPAGAEAMVDIQATGTNFQQGATAVGFGSSDVFVRQVFVLSPTHLLVDVSVGAGAALTTSDVSIFTGFQIATASSSFQITAATPLKPNVYPALFNAQPPLSGAYPGAGVSFYGSNLLNGNPVLTLNDRVITPLYSSPTQYNLLVPSDMPPGPAVLKLYNGTDAAFPVVVNIDPPPPVITSVQNGSAVNIDTSHPAHAGDVVTFTMSGFGDPTVAIATGRVHVNIGGTDHAPLSVLADANGLFEISLTLNSADPTGKTVPVIVYLDGRSSLPASIAIASATGSFGPDPDPSSTSGSSN